MCFRTGTPASHEKSRDSAVQCVFTLERRRAMKNQKITPFGVFSHWIAGEPRKVKGFSRSVCFRTGTPASHDKYRDIAVHCVFTLERRRDTKSPRISPFSVFSHWNASEPRKVQGYRRSVCFRTEAPASHENSRDSAVQCVFALERRRATTSPGISPFSVFSHWNAGEPRQVQGFRRSVCFRTEAPGSH